MFRRALTALALVLSPTALAQAGVYSLDLPGFMGPIETNQTPRIATFDFGLPFVSIEQVVIELNVENERQGVLELYSPTEREQFPLRLDMSAAILGEPGWSSPAQRMEVASPTHRISFINPIPHLRDNYAPLRDGSGELQLTSYYFFISTGHGPYFAADIVEPARGEIIGARLLVHGELAAVPEPSSLAMAVVAASILAASIAHAKRSRTCRSG